MRDRFEVGVLITRALVASVALILPGLGLS